MRIGSKIYFDKLTGNKILKTNELNEGGLQTTVDYDISVFTSLSERNRETFDVLELPFGAYAQDFAESNGYRVNVATKTLEFSYPDPNTPEASPVFQRPLTEEITGLTTRLTETENAVFMLMDLQMGGM